MIPDALLLDAGNTIVFADHAAMAAVLQGCGHAIEARAIRDCQAAANSAYIACLEEGAPHEDGWQTLMRTWVCAAGVAEAQAVDVVRALRTVHDDFNLWRRVPDDVIDALTRLREASIPLAVVSNSEGGLRALFERLDLARFFEVMIDSAEEGVRKPDPDIFLRACRRLGAEPARCLYAGDLPEVDVDGARRAGLAAALVDPLGAYPDYRDAPRFASLAELTDAILNDAL
jgi:HAD superfamily hydrolase (TIGR01662 family)